MQDSPAPRQHIWLPEKFLQRQCSTDFASPSSAGVIGILMWKVQEHRSQDQPLFLYVQEASEN